MHDAVEDSATGQPEFEVPTLDLRVLGEQVVQILCAEDIGRPNEISTDRSYDLVLIGRG